MSSYSRQREWIIVGAGLHGAHVACRLLDAGVAKQDLAMFDPRPRPLDLWQQRTEHLEMGYLRSTAVHHIDISPWSLINFVRERYPDDEDWCAPPYQRPRYDIFQKHCQWVVDKYGLEEVFLQSEVTSIKSGQRGGYRVVTDQGDWFTEKCVLALGQANPRLGSAQERDHLLSPSFCAVEPGQSIAVIGTGMTGAQFALSVAKRGVEVSLCGGPLNQLQDFDADPCWMGPRCLNDEFLRAHPNEKRGAILQARKPGSLNPQVHSEVIQAANSGKLRHYEGRPSKIDGSFLTLDSGLTLQVDRVVWATGFEPVRPGGPLVDALVKDLSLPTAPCGYPLTNDHLEWAPGLYVTGGLAELTLGPIARNIAGARNAGKLIGERCRRSALCGARAISI